MRDASKSARKAPSPRSLGAKVPPALEVPESTGSPLGRPYIREMGAASCLALLRREIVGRMAFSFHDRVDITPIHYVYANKWVFARTSHGAKMTTIAHVPWVAFEVDEVRSVFEWKSVVVHGTVYLAERDAGPTEARRWRTGIELLKRIVPETGTTHDPVAFRSLVFGIHIESLTGRISSLTRSSRS
jgi:nitroimidazol reductase NimA-like FMN-containing flavoprotein (pyridoxamine 5'-phosphate oxidase superfamily)